MALGGTPSHAPDPASTAYATASATSTGETEQTSPWSLHPPLIFAFVALGILITGASVLYWSRRVRGLRWDRSVMRAHAHAMFTSALNGRPLGKKPKLWEVELRKSRLSNSWADVRPLSVCVDDFPREQDPEQVGEFGELPTPVTTQRHNSPWTLVNGLYSSLTPRRSSPSTTLGKDPKPPPLPSQPATPDLHLFVPILMPTPRGSSESAAPPVYCLGISHTPFPYTGHNLKNDEDDENMKPPPTPLPYPSMPWLSATDDPSAPVQIPRSAYPRRSSASNTRASRTRL